MDAPPVTSSNSSRASSDWTRSASVERESPLCCAKFVARRGSPSRTSLSTPPASGSWPLEHVHELTRLRAVNRRKYKIELVFSRVDPPESVNLLLDIWAKGRASFRDSCLEERFASPLRGRGSSVLSTLGPRGSRVHAWSASPHPRRRRGLLAAAALGAERSFATAEELVEAPDVDVVHICTPNHLHLPLAEAALAAGKHVICEKPLAVDDRGAEEMADAAARAGRDHRGAVRLPLLPDGARGARAHPQPASPARSA